MNKEELKQKILEANNAYRFGDAIISDQEFDSLVEEIEKLMSPDEFSEFRDSLNEKTNNESKKVKHPYVMGSLNKLKYEEPESIIKFCKKYVGTLCVSAKVDGISCRLHYENGKLVSASTRGDGTFGEDLTDKIKFVKGVPEYLGNTQKTGKCGDLIKNIDIRGELVILKEDFKTMTGFANPRNACAGIMNRKEWTKEDVSKVSFIPYTILGKEFPKAEQFALLQGWGGFTPAWSKTQTLFSYKNLVEELYSYVNQDFDYEVDGLVICDAYYRNEDKYRPDACAAFKINQLVGKTRLINVSWEGPSKDGYIIPVGILTPLNLGGSLISRVALHNLDVMRNQLNIDIGDDVEILKSGDIIPKITKVYKNNFKKIVLSQPTDEVLEIIKVIDSVTDENVKYCSERWDAPLFCPCCGRALKRDGINIRCVNKNCSGQVIYKIMHFIKKLGVMNCSFATLSNFKIFSFKDLFAFTPNKKYKSEVKLSEELYNKVFTRSKPELLAAMNFQGVGETLINKIIDFYGFENVCNHKFNGLPSGIGEIILSKFEKELDDNLKIVNMIVSDSRYHYVPTQIVQKTEIKGSVCFTGSLNTITRGKAIALAEKKGYVVKSSVSKGLTYLVTNDTTSGSSKNKKAKELGTKIINEEQFLVLMGELDLSTKDLDNL